MRKIVFSLLLTLCLLGFHSSLEAQSTTVVHRMDATNPNFTFDVSGAGPYSHAVTYTPSTTNGTVTAIVTASTDGVSFNSVGTSALSADTITFTGTYKAITVSFANVTGSLVITMVYTGAPAVRAGVFGSPPTGAVAYFKAPGLLGGDSSLTYTGGLLTVGGSVRLHTDAAQLLFGAAADIGFSRTNSSTLTTTGTSNLNITQDLIVTRYMYWGSKTLLSAPSDGGLSIQNNAQTVTATLVTEANNTLAQRNGANAQTFNLYGTFTDASNYERLRIVKAAGGAASIVVENAGTGTATSLEMKASGASGWLMAANTNVFRPEDDNASALCGPSNRCSNLFSVLGTFGLATNVNGDVYVGKNANIGVVGDASNSFGTSFVGDSSRGTQAAKTNSGSGDTPVALVSSGWSGGQSWRNTLIQSYIDGAVVNGQAPAQGWKIFTNAVNTVATLALTIDSSQNATHAGSVSSAGGGAGTPYFGSPYLGWKNATLLRGDTDGILKLTNNAVTDFNRLQFGGTTSSFPALKRVGANLSCVVADDSGGCGLTVNALTLSTGTVLVNTTSSFTNGAAAASGTLTNAPTAGNPTKWIAINDNGVTRYMPAW